MEYELLKFMKLNKNRMWFTISNAIRSFKTKIYIDGK